MKIKYEVDKDPINKLTNFKVQQNIPKSKFIDLEVIATNRCKTIKCNNCKKLKRITLSNITTKIDLCHKCFNKIGLDVRANDKFGTKFGRLKKRYHGER